MINFDIPAIINFDLSFSLVVILAILLIFIVLRIAFCNNLTAIIIYMSVVSLLVGVIYLLMDAPDVAMTEVALGSCVSTIILLQARLLTKQQRNNLNIIKSSFISSSVVSYKKIIVVSILCIMLVSVLVVAGIEVAEYGSISNTMSLGQNYINRTKEDIRIDSVVAAILASYRGFDTLGETSVILIAGLGIVLILMNEKNEEI